MTLSLVNTKVKSNIFFIKHFFYLQSDFRSDLFDPQITFMTIDFHLFFEIWLKMKYEKRLIILNQSTYLSVMIGSWHEMFESPRDVGVNREYFTELDWVTWSKTEETIVERESSIIERNNFLVVVWSVDDDRKVKDKISVYCIVDKIMYPWTRGWVVIGVDLMIGGSRVR